MTMEQAMQLHESKPIPTIKRHKIFRYRFVDFRKNGNIARSSDETHLDWRYWHSFSIGYDHMEVDYFRKEIGWYYRQKKILIPKLLNNTLKFIFGKRYYSISRNYGTKESPDVYHSEMVDKKTMNNYIEEYKHEDCIDIYVSYKEIKYDGWIWVTKKEKDNEESMMKFFVNLWSQG